MYPSGVAILQAQAQYTNQWCMIRGDVNGCFQTLQGTGVVNADQSLKL